MEYFATAPACPARGLGFRVHTGATVVVVPLTTQIDHLNASVILGIWVSVLGQGPRRKGVLSFGYIGV